MSGDVSLLASTTSEYLTVPRRRLICPLHPENAFFEQFANALIYSSPEEFSSKLAHALSNEPPSLTDDDHRCASCCARAESPEAVH